MLVARLIVFCLHFMTCYTEEWTEDWGLETRDLGHNQENNSPNLEPESIVVWVE